MNVYIPYTRLPSEYQEVEYIQSTGTQAIDCNIVIGATKLKTDLKINSQYIGESAIFLSRWALNGNLLMFYNNAFRWHSASAVDVSCALNTDYSIQTENGKITINGTSYTCTASSSDSGSDLSMCIFGKSGAPTYGRFKLYYMKMWNNTTLVRDLVPCYRKSDSVIGMYDLVNNQFYTNSGTGTFSKGNDVNMSVLKNAYIGEYKKSYLVSIDDINLQSQWTNTNGIVVSGSNPVVYTGPGSDRYRGGYTTQTWTLPTKGKMYIDGIRGPHNYSGESWRGIGNSNTQFFTWRQRSVSDSTSYPSIIVFGSFYDISLDYRNNNRHTFIIERNNGIANAWLDDTQVLTNTGYSHSSQNFFFQIQGGRNSGGVDNPKSIYNFYVESLD